MTTGTLMIQGNHVLDWFLGHFQSIMDHYDAPVQEQQPKTEAFKQYTESWKKLENENTLKKGIDYTDLLNFCKLLDFLVILDYKDLKAIPSHLHKT